MSGQTKIQWADSTVNFWSGCTQISPGCLHCYAETMDQRHLIEPVSHWGPVAPRLIGKGAVKLALALNRRPMICDECGADYSIEEFSDPDVTKPMCSCSARCHRRRIFTLSRGDIGDPEVPLPMFNEAMVTIDQCRNCDWLVLTKRPREFLERWQRVCEHWGRFDKSLPPNVWFGISAENQACLDSRWDQAKQIRATVHFISVEPMLEPIDFRPVIAEAEIRNLNLWPIFGGESGPGARPCDVNWIRAGVKQFQAAGVPMFVKQLGARPYESPAHDGATGFEYTLADKKGGDLSEWPADLRVRQFPTIPLF